MVRWEPLRGESNTIGSSAQLSRFVLANEEVAPHHATIQLTEAGWQIDQIDPKAAILLNQQPISQALIAPDDVVDLGSQRLLIQLKAVSWMWPLPAAFLVTLLSVAIFSLRRRHLNAKERLQAAGFADNMEQNRQSRERLESSAI